MTPNVWLTRAGSLGPFNIKTESFYTDGLSPADTEWAYGDLADYASLTYSPWSTWNGHHAVDMIGQPAVLHLISENIYLSIMFTSWDAHGAGGFSYVRSTPGVAPPPSPARSRLNGSVMSANAGFQITFTNSPGFTFSVLSTTNLTLPASNWTVLGTVTDSPSGSGQYSFTDATATSAAPPKFYQLRWP